MLQKNKYIFILLLLDAIVILQFILLAGNSDIGYIIISIVAIIILGGLTVTLIIRKLLS